MPGLISPSWVLSLDNEPQIIAQMVRYPSSSLMSIQFDRESLRQFGHRDVELDALRQFIDIRAQTNIDKTGHPFHHVTANGTIVDADSPLEDAIECLPLDDLEQVRNEWLQYINDPLDAVPVDRLHYGFDPFAK